MTVQKEANARLREIAPGVVRFVEGKVGEILSVDVVNDNLQASIAAAQTLGGRATRKRPHLPRHWCDDRSRGSERSAPHGIRVLPEKGYFDILQRHIAADEDGERVIHLMSHTLDEEIRAFPGNRDAQRLMLYVPSPIEEGSFSLSIREQDKGSEQLYVRLVEEWRHRFGRLIPNQLETMSPTLE